MAIQDSIAKGLEWLVSKQNVGGGWLVGNPVATSGLSILKLENYAREMGLSPFDDNYIYKDNVERGLNYIFANAKQDANGVYFQDSSYINYTTGIILAAICANGEPSKVVNVAGSLVNTWTYKQVAQAVVNYLAWSQQDSGNNIGGWAYEKGDTPDNSVSGYPTLGLAFAKSSSYNYLCTIPAAVKQNLNSWISFIQNANGGSGYQTADQWVNILKTGNLIQQMHLYGDPLASARLNKAIKYIADNWTGTVCQTGCTGWNANPADYQATFATMKGLSSYGVDIITTTGGTNIDWFADMSSVIMNQQNANGSWPRSQWDTGTEPVLSAAWALLTLEKVVPSPSEIPFRNNVTVSSVGYACPMDLTQSVDVEGEVKIFAHKYSHSEAECKPNTKPGKGDDIGFTLVFGNYGEFSYVAVPGTPTVEDTLFIQSPVILKLMSLCLCDNLRLYNITDKKVVEVCDKFYGGTPYLLQVQKKDGTAYKPDFDLPCHSIFCISMLFQVEFPACPKCPDDEP